MDVQLQELVDKIRKDGVETAEAKAAEIIKNAEEKAASILKAARGDAEALIQTAKNEAERSEKSAVSSIRQAGRNLLIVFRDGIVAELDSIVKAETSKAYDASLLAALIPRAVESWIEKSGQNDIALLLSSSDLEKMESGLTSALKSQISKGLVIRADSSLDGGFRIGTKDGAAYYDFSAESVAALFSAYLNPRVAEILRSAAKEM